MPFGDTSKHTLEICCTGVESAKVAQKAGADRIELCANLEQGGITPSYGMIKECLKRLTIPLHVLIRPRAGNFNCGGVAGVVIGTIGLEHCVYGAEVQRLKSYAGDMEVTYNRHFDDTLDLTESLEEVIEAGCTRILTSGGQETAEKGIDVIGALVREAESRITIMAGSGITFQNVKEIVEATGVREIHASCRRKKRTTDHKSLRRGLFDADEWVVDEKAVRRLVEELQSLEPPAKRRKNNSQKAKDDEDTLTVEQADALTQADGEPLSMREEMRLGLLVPVRDSREESTVEPPEPSQPDNLPI